MFELFLRIGRDLFLSGQNDSKSGNISVKDGRKIWITSKSAVLSNLRKEDVLELDLYESSELDAQASRDFSLHKAIYKIFNAGAIIHSHAEFGIVLSLTENKIIMQDLKGQGIFPQGVPIIRVRYGMTYDEIEKIISQNYNGYQALMVRSHGVYTAGENLESAFENITCFNNSCRIVYDLKNSQPKIQAQPVPPQKKRSAIPPSIGVMDRRSTHYRRDMKR